MINPSHSRPIDVHRWSDHPQVREVTDELWLSDAFADLRDDGGARRGPKPKTRFRDQLRILILDLYVAWREDPSLSIGVSMRLGDWKANSRYNALHLSSVIPDLIHRLHIQGWIYFSAGSYSGPGAKSNRTSRIQAADPLIAKFDPLDLDPNELEAARDEETVILRDTHNKNIDYDDNDHTNQWRAELAAYNDLLRNSFIDIPGLQEPYIERQINAGKRAGQVQKIRVGRRDTTVRRIFSRGVWDRNGRYNGGWWQQVGKEHRQQIYINDEPTVEIDYQGLHVSILSREAGKPLEDDPYNLRPGVLPDLEPEEQRGWVKHLVLTAINAKDLPSAFQAFREHFPVGHRAKSLTNDQLGTLLAAFFESHPHLEPYLGADQGIRLMHLDSEVARFVINHFTANHTPILCIHDSFIAQAGFADELQAVMAYAATSILGGGFTTNLTPGLRAWDQEYDGDDAPPDRPVVTDGYRRRMDSFRRWQDAKAPVY